MPRHYLVWGCSDNTGCQSYERAHREFVKSAWEHTNQKEAEGQVMLRNNRESHMRSMAGEAARYVQANPDDEYSWRDLHPDELQATLKDRREREVEYYPTHMAATPRYLKHRTVEVAVGGYDKKAGSARTYISTYTVGTPGDVYVRDNPGLMYLNQSLVNFLINFYGNTLRTRQVSLAKHYQCLDKMQLYLAKLS